MADRVKYFLLGVLFLVVAGVIAYDRWNSAGEPRDQDVAESPGVDSGVEYLSVGPDAPKVEPKSPVKANEGSRVAIDPEVVPDEFQPQPRRLPDLPAGPEKTTPAPPAKSEPKVEAKPAPKSLPDRTHVIRKGDTLESLAIKYYGTREGVQWIVSANGLRNANRIYANQKLVIPARKEIAKEGGSGGAAPAKAATDNKLPSRYRVKEGDGDLYAICQRIYGHEGQGARVSRIMELNHLWSAEVKAGTVLILPPR